MRKTRRLYDITESGDALLNMHLLTSEKRRKQMFIRYRRSIGAQDDPLFHQSFGRALRVQTTPRRADTPFDDIEAGGPTVRELIDRGFLSAFRVNPSPRASLHLVDMSIT